MTGVQTCALPIWALPDVEQRFRFITPGSVVGVLIWMAASWGFSVYVRNFGSYDATYGALGGVIVLLLWMWISAQALLLGAEINAILEHESAEGKRRGARRLAERGESRVPGEGRGEETPPPPPYPGPGRQERTLH